MALKRCVECNNPISTDVFLGPCPRCGNKDPFRYRVLIGGILFFGVIAVALYFHFN